MKPNKKLKVNRETIRQLENADLVRAGGGLSDPTIDGPCTSMRTCQTFNATCRVCGGGF